MEKKQDTNPRRPVTHFAPVFRKPTSQLVIDIKKVSELPHFSSIINTINSLVLVLNSCRQIVFANQFFLDAFGIDKCSSLHGLRPGEALGCENAVKAPGGCGTSEFCTTCGAVQAILNALKGVEDVQECRITKMGSGDCLDLRVWASPLSVDKAPFTVFFVKDISHEKRRASLERIFFHDVTNSVTGLIGLVELIAMTQTDKKNQYVDLLCTNSRLFIEQIKAQRDLVAAESNELQLQLSTIAVGGFVETLVESYRGQKVARGKVLILKTSLHPLTMTTDKTLLSRVIGNMIKNALEASEKGQTVTVGFELTGDQKDHVRFWVHNQTLIPKNVQLQIFNRSFSTKGSGRGLGTYGMKLLSKRYLGGRVFFNSSPDEGTIFSAIYPLRLDG